MPPKLRVFATNPRFEQRAKMDISASLAAILKTRPQISSSEAMWSVREQLLANNPYEPPSNGKCPINELPAEILGHIFEIGAEMQEEGEEMEEEEDGWEDVSDDDDDDVDDDGDVDDYADYDGLDGRNLRVISSPGSNGSSILSALSAADDEDPLFQILVSHVCRHWREVALNSHTLWTTLDFDNVLQLEKSKVFIERAHGLPLKIHIDCVIPDDEDHPDHPLYSQSKEAPEQDGDHDFENFLSQNDLMQILDLIEPEVSHWGELDFHVSTYSYVQSLLERLHKIPNAPLLKKFHMYSYEDCDDFELFSSNDSDKTAYLPFHGNAPLLESAIFWGVHIDWDNSLHFLQGLHEFGLSFHSKDVRPSYATFTQIIKNSPELHTLSLALSGPFLSTGSQFDDEGQWGPEPFDIPSVLHLTLQYDDPPSASALIQHFYFPNVRSLTLDFDSEDYSSFVRKLLVPVKGRSTSILPGLESLKISGLPCDITTIEEMLKQLTNLKAFELNCFGSEELVIFRKLIDPMAGRMKKGESQVSAVAQALPKIFCPLLETFTVMSVSESRIKRLVMARKVAGAPLKTLRLSNDDCISTKTQEWLKNHVEVLEFFDPSDSEEEIEVSVDEEDGEDDNDDDDDDESDDEEDEDEDEDPTLGPHGVPVTPITQYLLRTGRSTLD